MVTDPHAAHTPVGLAEIAARLGVKRTTAGQWRTRGILATPPRWVVSGSPAWCWEHDILPLDLGARRPGRPPDPLVPARPRRKATR